MWPTIFIIAVFTLIALTAWSLAKMAAPQTAEERRLDDEDQMAYLKAHAARKAR
jgi:hypothetical protein